MASKTNEQNIAVFGASGSGKTVLLSSFYGATQEPVFHDKNLYKVIADETSQGLKLHQNYLKMKNTALVPEGGKFAATRYSFTVKPKNGGDPKIDKAKSFNSLRLVWHDYPGGWFEDDPSSEEEAKRRVETFTTLLKSDVALVLVDGQKLLDYAREEEKYLKSMLRGLSNGLEKLKDEILTDGSLLTEFPRIWVIALSKADLHPGLDVEGFKNLIVEKAAGDLSMLQDTVRGFVQVPDALSMGEDFMLLSSAKFTSDRIEVTQRVGLDLILPVATMLPLERVAQWAERMNIPLKVLGSLVDNVNELATVLTTGAMFATKFLAKVPKVGPVLSKVAIPALVTLVRLSTPKLEELYAQAIADRDYLTATLTQFRLDLDRGVKDKLLAKSPW